MSFLASVVFSAFLLNPSNQIDSLKTKPMVDVINATQMSTIVEKDTVNNAVDVEKSSDVDNLKAVKVKLDFGILFESGESTLNKATKEALNKISEILIKNPTTKIVVVGYTDNISSLDLNQKLSENRAQVVADYLITKNVNATQLKDISGKNFTEPVANNSTEAGRAANRRVEMYLILSPIVKNPLVSSVVPRDSIKTKLIPVSLKKIFENVIQQPLSKNEVEIEIDGLLVDDTKTKAGKDFYDLFYSGWEVPSGAKNYSITVSEKPFRLTSTLIVISINDDIVYQTVLQPRQDIIEAQAEEAISMTQNYLANYEEITRQLNGDDMAGSGIY